MQKFGIALRSGSLKPDRSRGVDATGKPQLTYRHVTSRVPRCLSEETVVKLVVLVRLAAYIIMRGDLVDLARSKASVSPITDRF